MGKFYDRFFSELNHSQLTNVYSLKVIKPKFEFRLMPIRFENKSTVLLIALPFLKRSPFLLLVFLLFRVALFGCLMANNLFEIFLLYDFGIVVVEIGFVGVVDCARGAYIKRLSMAMISLSISSSITSMSSHFGKWNRSCSIGFFNQFPKSSRRKASNNSRFAA